MEPLPDRSCLAVSPVALRKPLEKMRVTGQIEGLHIGAELLREGQVIRVAGKIGEFRLYAAYVAYFAEPLQILDVNNAGMDDLRRRLWFRRWGRSVS